MTYSPPKEWRVLALHPTNRGFGFVVLESPATLVDWGVTATKADTIRVALAKISNLIEHYAPELLVAGLPDRALLPQRGRTRRLLEEVSNLASNKGLRWLHLTRRKMCALLTGLKGKTKHEISLAVAEQLPDLAPYLPRRRKPWTKEDYSMAIFEAAALALAYFKLKHARMPKVLSTEMDQRAFH